MTMALKVPNLVKENFELSRCENTNVSDTVVMMLLRAMSRSSSDFGSKELRCTSDTTSEYQESFS